MVYPRSLAEKPFRQPGRIHLVSRFSVSQLSAHLFSQPPQRSRFSVNVSFFSCTTVPIFVPPSQLRMHLYPLWKRMKIYPVGIPQRKALRGEGLGSHARSLIRWVLKKYRGTICAMLFHQLRECLTVAVYAIEKQDSTLAVRSIKQAKCTINLIENVLCEDCLTLARLRGGPQLVLRDTVKERN